MGKSLDFVFNVIAKHIYTILTSIEFQWIFDLPISEHTIHSETRGAVLIDFFSVDPSGLGLGSSIGLRLASKYPYMMNGILNWFCPL